MDCAPARGFDLYPLRVARAERRREVTSPRKAALDWTCRALADEIRENEALLTTRAENLLAIAEHFDIPIEVLVKWIHTPARGKRWTAAEWRRWCERYRAGCGDADPT